MIDTPIHGVIDDETGNLCLSSYNYGKHDLPTADGVVSVTKMLVGQAGKYYYGVSDDNSDSYNICTCSLDSKGKNGTMKGYTLQTNSGNITFSMMFYIGIGDTKHLHLRRQVQVPDLPMPHGPGRIIEGQERPE